MKFIELSDTNGNTILLKKDSIYKVKVLQEKNLNSEVFYSGVKYRGYEYVQESVEEIRRVLEES